MKCDTLYPVARERTTLHHPSTVVHHLHIGCKGPCVIILYSFIIVLDTIHSSTGVQSNNALVQTSFG
jgi:hypothetical protein